MKGGYALKIASPPVLIKLYSASAEQSLSKFKIYPRVVHANAPSDKNRRRDSYFYWVSKPKETQPFARP